MTFGEGPEQAQAEMPFDCWLRPPVLTCCEGGMTTMSATEDFKSDLIEGLEAKRTNILRLGGNLIDRVRDGLLKYGCERRGELLLAAKSAYDELAKKIDVPIVAEPLESQLEEQLWLGWISPTLNKIADQICGETIA
jgi:hypothetical protein